MYAWLPKNRPSQNESRQGDISKEKDRHGERSNPMPMISEMHPKEKKEKEGPSTR
jgi:hypothetical protein